MKTNTEMTMADDLNIQRQRDYMSAIGRALPEDRQEPIDDEDDMEIQMSFYEVMKPVLLFVAVLALFGWIAGVLAK